MTLQRSITRREILGSASLVGALSLAGCGDADSASGESGGDGSETDGDEFGPDDDESGSGDGESAENLDLREANVVGVEFDADGTTYSFDVTLQHDDDGEDGYANWWQVERLDGLELGRRDLAHAHSNQPFTRSATIEIPDDLDCVVVRGHDQTHGYGGQVMAVSLATGAREAIQQGSDPETITEDACP
jgi:hypothetical protein